MKLSDTPRTDALLFPGLDLADAFDIVDLARQLESELAQSEAARKVAEEEVNALKHDIGRYMMACNAEGARTALAESRVRELEVVLTRMCDLIGREDEVRTPWLDDALEAARAVLAKGKP